MRIACFTSSLNNPRQRENRFLAFKCLISDAHVQNVFICYKIIICSEFGKKKYYGGFFFFFCSVYIHYPQNVPVLGLSYNAMATEGVFGMYVFYKSRKSNPSSIEQAYPFFFNSCDIRLNMNGILFTFFIFIKS